MQIRIKRIPSAEKPSPIIISSRLSCLSARTPAGTLNSSVGRNPSSVTSAMLAALPDCKIKYLWATQDCMSLDDIPYIGRYSKNTPDMYVASGFNKWGMTGSMLAAILLSDMVCGRNSDYAAAFSPSRSILKPQLFVNGFEATKNLLTPSKKRCPHLGCALKWNNAEHSWDCACHGSRFDEVGRVIDNPANGNMKRDN